MSIELDVSATPESTEWTLWRKHTKEESAPWILVQTVEGGRNQTHLNRTATIGSVYSAPAGGASYQKAANYSKNVPSLQAVDGQYVPPPASAMVQTPALTE